ncbi:hypothetical protein ABGB07_43945 [Micromonosporaceae bacterium B7E4]
MTSLPDPTDNGTPEQGIPNKLTPRPDNLVADPLVRAVIRGTSTADLYELCAAVLTELNQRGERIEGYGTESPDPGVAGRYASVHAEGDRWRAVFYTEETAEDASRQFGGNPLGTA